MKSNNEFYIGYLPEMPADTRTFLRSRVMLAVVGALLIAGLVVATQSSFYPSTFEFGQVKEFVGTIDTESYPTLKVRKPGAAKDAATRYYLVAFGKQGAFEAAAKWAGQTVRLRGTLIYHENQTMIEIAPGDDSIVALDPSAPPPDITSEQLRTLAENGSNVEELGTMTLTGEIVDSKCYLGVMNPGRGKLHRACAVRCISGGIPPVLMVRDEQDGSAAYLMLVSETGAAVNKEVLPFVAVPVRITGNVSRRDNLLIMKADPATYERLE